MAGGALSAAQITHILAARAKILQGRTVPVVFISQSNNPISTLNVNPLAIPAAPVITDGGAGGSWPGGNVYAQVIALNANGQTLPSAEAGPVNVPINHLVRITVPNTANATSIRVYVSQTSNSETFQGAAAPGAVFTISAPLVGGAEATPFQSYTLINAIIRHERGILPSKLDESGVSSDRRLMAILFECLITQNLDGLEGSMLAETSTPTPAAVGATGILRYAFIDLVTTGIVPGGDRYVGMLRRTQ